MPKEGPLSEKHPYANADSALVQLLDQFRKSFPAVVDASYLKKLALAPNNESYLVNVIRFLGLIDEEEGKRTDIALRTFTLHEDKEFHESFAGIVQNAYKGLFDIHKDEAWNLPDNKLVAFFRQTDQSSQIVGSRQAKTFRFLAAYVGKSSEPKPAPKSRPQQKSASVKAAKSSPKLNGKERDSNTTGIGQQQPNGKVNLTVRIEVNLPAGGDQDTYDKIFKSIRENLMNG